MAGGTSASRDIIMQSERQRSGAQNLVRILDILVMCVVCTRTRLLWNKHWIKILPGLKERLWWMER